MWIVTSEMGREGPDYFVENKDTGKIQPITFDSHINAQALADYLNEEEKSDNSTQRKRNVRSKRA